MLACRGRFYFGLRNDFGRCCIIPVNTMVCVLNLSRSSYEKEWGKDYQRPSAGEKFLAFLLRILPKIGPLKILTFRTPTPEAEKLFENSFNKTVERYRHLLPN